MNRSWTGPTLVAGGLLLGMTSPLPSAEDDRIRWDETFTRRPYDPDVPPAEFLESRRAQIKERVPRGGRALDIAAGAGRNAVFLARLGLEVDAVDISPVGLQHARKLAGDRGVRIGTIQADLETWEMPRESYDLIVNEFYLQRSLFPKIVAALKPGGMLVFETFTVDRLGGDGHAPRREYLLEHNELLEAFGDGLRILFYEEVTDPAAAVARLVAIKPAVGSPGPRSPPGP